MGLGNEGQWRDHSSPHMVAFNAPYLASVPTEGQARLFPQPAKKQIITLDKRWVQVTCSGCSIADWLVAVGRGVADPASRINSTADGWRRGRARRIPNSSWTDTPLLVVGEWLLLVPGHVPRGFGLLQCSQSQGLGGIAAHASSQLRPAAARCQGARHSPPSRGTLQRGKDDPSLPAEGDRLQAIIAADRRPRFHEASASRGQPS